MSLLNLPAVPVPPEAARAEGCSCKGLDLHLLDCTIFVIPREQATQAIAAAHRRIQDHTDALNRQLNAELQALRQGSSA
jgi:hypothetical protein